MSEKKTAIGGLLDLYEKLCGPDPLRNLREMDPTRHRSEWEMAVGAIKRFSAAVPGDGIVAEAVRRSAERLAAAGGRSALHTGAIPSAMFGPAARPCFTERERAAGVLANYRVATGLPRPEVTEKMKRAAAIRAFGRLHLPPGLADEHARLVDSLAELVP